MTVPTCRPFRLLGAVRRSPPDYPLALAMSPDSKHVAAANASGSISIIDGNTLSTAIEVPSTTRSTSTFSSGSAAPSLDGEAVMLDGDVLSQIQFHHTDSALLFSASKSASTVTLWDLRAQSPAAVWNIGAPALSFDINSTGSVMSVGTELVGDDAAIHFWDMRTIGGNPIASFKDCHSDDVTQIKFHPTRPQTMMSGSTDGLVCIYNLESFVEDNALDQVINDNSVSKLGYFGADHEYIYSVTHMETVSLWRFQDREKIALFGDVRGVSDEFKLDYVIDCTYDTASQRLYVISGSQEGSIGICNVSLEGLNLVYTLHGGHSDIVRSAIWSTAHGGLVSAGEDGAVAFWAP